MLWLLQNALNLINKSKLKEDRINNFVTALNKELNCLSENGSDCTDVEEASLNVENNNLLTKQGCTNDDSVPCLSYAQNSEVPAGCDAIKITYNETMGRHIVAVKDINPGRRFFHLNILLIIIIKIYKIMQCVRVCMCMYGVCLHTHAEVYHLHADLYKSVFFSF